MSTALAIAPEPSVEAAGDDVDRNRRFALLIANHVRTTRRQLKEDVKAGRRSIDSLLRNPPAELRTMALGDLVRALPHYGPKTTALVIAHAGARPGTGIGEMSPSERDAVLDVIRIFDNVRDSRRVRPSYPTPTGKHRPVDLEQASAAKAHGDEIRLARARLRHDVAAGRVFAGDAILANPPEARTMTVFDLLCCQRRWGVARTGALLDDLGCSETKTIGSLTERQRRLIAEHLP